MAVTIAVIIILVVAIIVVGNKYKVLFNCEEYLLMEVHRQLYCGKFWVEIYIPGLGVFIFSDKTAREADQKADKFLEEHKDYR